jgi:hypothetical protein
MSCRHCGALNGRSATVCWGCDGELWPAEPFGFVAGPAWASAPVAGEPAVAEVSGSTIELPAEATEPVELRMASEATEPVDIRVASEPTEPVELGVASEATEPVAAASLASSPSLDDGGPPSDGVSTRCDVGRQVPASDRPVERDEPPATPQLPRVATRWRAPAIVGSIVLVAGEGLAIALQLRWSARGAGDAGPAAARVADAGAGVAAVPAAVVAHDARPMPTGTAPAGGAMADADSADADSAGADSAPAAPPAALVPPAMDVPPPLIEPSVSSPAEISVSAGDRSPSSTQSATTDTPTRSSRPAAPPTARHAGARRAAAAPDGLGPLKPEAPEAGTPTTAPVGPCTAKLVSLGLCAEIAANQPAAPAAKPLPRESARPAPLGPCTASLVSLGLCNGPPSQSKE